MGNRDNKKKLACPVCGNEELQFLSVQKKEKKSEFLMACATICIFTIFILAIAICIAFSNWTNMPNDEVTTDAINIAITMLIMFNALFTLLLIFFLCNGFHKTNSYANETNFICTKCGNQNALNSLLNEEKHDHNPKRE